MKRKISQSFGSVLILGALISIVSCGGKTATPAVVSTKVQVKVQTAVERDVEQLGEFTGTIKPYVRNSISSATVSRINKILVEVGDMVTKGQLLVEMEPSSYLQASAQIENLKVEYERIKVLFATGGASKQQVDELKTQLDVSEASIKNLYDNTHLVSPVSGVITARSFDNGDMVGTSSILVVEQLNPLKIFINISEEYFALVKNGMPVNISLEVYPNKKFQGRISLIYPTIDEITRTFNVEITMNNEQMLVRPGMFARATINFGSKMRTLIPDIAVQKQSGSNERFIFVIKDGIAHRRTVELGRRLEAEVEVLRGVVAGEQIATAGVTRLVDQIEIELIQ
ncbi:MAG: efflux RND transporter periplasmic adaptor subunit [Bacteroidales bacterium]